MQPYAQQPARRASATFLTATISILLASLRNLAHFSFMEFPRRNRLPHDVPSWVRDGSFFFVTICCSPRGKNQLACTEIGEGILSAARFNHEKLYWHCRLMLLMPDHLHAIIAFPANAAMKRTLARWKRFVASKYDINWQRDFFDHRLRNAHEETEKISYILMNPVRRGLCGKPDDWPWIFRPNDRPSPIIGQ